MCWINRPRRSWNRNRESDGARPSSALWIAQAPDVLAHGTGKRVVGGLCRKGVGVSVTPTSNLKAAAKFTAKGGHCGNVEEDFGISIPDGWSVGLGATYKRK